MVKLALNKPLLRVKSVTKRFGGVEALRNVNLDLMQGTIAAIIGPNGAGKTSLFNVLTGLYAPDAGSVSFGEPLKVISHLRPDQIAAQGIIRNFQSIRLFKEMTVLDNLRIGQHLKSRTSLKDILFHTKKFSAEEDELTTRGEKILEFVGLSAFANETASNLAYGQQRILEIGRALVADPKLLLLDEPVAGMNPSETSELMKLVQNIRNIGITVLLIEHDMRMVMSICEKIFVLDHGELIADGTPEQIAKNQLVIDAYLGRKKDSSKAGPKNEKT